MILVDTSIWIDHLRETNGAHVALLQSDAVGVHPWIIGELACGNLRNRKEVLELLGALPQLMPASDGEVLHFIERRHLMGRGVGYSTCICSPLPSFMWLVFGHAINVLAALLRNVVWLTPPMHTDCSAA